MGMKLRTEMRTRAAANILTRKAKSTEVMLRRIKRDGWNASINRRVFFMDQAETAVHVSIRSEHEETAQRLHRIMGEGEGMNHLHWPWWIAFCKESTWWSEWTSIVSSSQESVWSRSTSQSYAVNIKSRHAYRCPASLDLPAVWPWETKLRSIS